jgi:hypothetical protein
MLPPAKSLANLDRSSLPSVCDGTDIERLLDRTLAESRTKADTRGDPSPNPASSGSLLAAAAGLSPLIWPPNDRSPMGSDAPRSVGSVGTTNRMVVPITVMVRICLANSHSPIGADASGSVDSIGTSGCMARLRKHERSKCNYDGEHHCAISGEAQRSVFHLGTFGLQELGIIHRCSTAKTPAITTGVSVGSPDRHWTTGCDCTGHWGTAG